ncbi:MAG: hypothetical protein HY671_11790 [Chloroflexi bacterium]|nr:hypothetical protein [Chloroflexota bacterium]
MKDKSNPQLTERAFISLERALQHSHCCICRLVRETEEQHIWFLLYEHAGDPPLRRRFDDASGFCHYHGHLAARILLEREMMSESAMARFYETAVMTYREALQQAIGAKRNPRAAFRGGKTPGVPSASLCMACESSRHAVAGNIAALLRILGDEGHRLDYVKSDGLCNPHLALAVQKADADAGRFLLGDHERRMEKLQNRLSELLRKQAFDSHETPTAAELASWADAVWRFTGVEWKELLVRREDAKTLDRPGHKGRQVLSPSMGES